MFSYLFHVILYKPIFNIFVALYNVIPGHDVGVVILLITLFIRLVLYPLTSAGIKAQRSMQELQPKLEALKKEFKGDQQKQAAATMQLYKEHKVNPVSSCLPILVQLPILIALYLVLKNNLLETNVNMASDLYAFVSNPGKLNAVSLGFLNLAAPSIVMAVLAGAAQFLQAKTLSRAPVPKEAGAGGKDESMAVMMNKQMLYMMPVLTVIIGINLQSGLTLYWFLSTAMMAAQQWILRPKNEPAGGSGAITPTVIDEKK